MLDDKLFYMNTPSGTVQMGIDWKNDQKHDGFPESDLDKLTEVEWSSVEQYWIKA